MSSSRETLGIVGLGAIGGSLALAVRDIADVVVWSRDATDRDEATRAGLAVAAEDAGSWARAFQHASMIVIAVPLDQVASVARTLLESVPHECLVTHVGSLQSRAAVGLIEDLHARVIGTHPVAGSERSGFVAARRTMFRGACLRAESRAAPSQRARIEEIWRAAGITSVVWDDADRHDALMAWVSHLPQLAATALSATLAHSLTPASTLGPGGRDVTRLAASDFTLWKPLLDRAPRETTEALGQLTRTLQDLRAAIEHHDTVSLAAMWEQGRIWKTTEDRAP
jgi:prephenate dehydrogenase